MVDLDPNAIRVFISSTFLDMKAERDLLAKEVFPELRQICEAQGVALDEVDLRWGITRQEAERGETLPLCLAEIDRCRPFFICMLGERYGWVPQKIPTELVDRQPWLRDHIRHSVTALEIIHGVFQDKSHIENALFYFRDPAYISELSELEQAAFRESPIAEEIASYGPDEARRMAAQRSLLLERLKEQIRRSGAKVVDGYRNPAEFARQVAQDLADIIRPMLPASSLEDPLERERTAHDAFAKNWSKGHVFDRVAHVELDSFLIGNRTAISVTGRSGSGKSSTLAAWSRTLGESTPDQLLLKHFVGATPGSADWEQMVRRLLHELGRATGKKAEPPKDKVALPAAFARALCDACDTRRVVIILDAVDQLEDRDGARELAWLPVSLPDRARLVLSASEGSSLEAARRREWPALELAPLCRDRKRLIADGYLSRFSKRLDEHRLERLLEASQTDSPLFLLTLLEELRLMGGHDSLDHQLSCYLGAADATELFGMVIERWENDYSHEGSGWVREALILILASRRGLTESEILELAGANGSPLPRAHWSRLAFAADKFLVSRSGMVGFSHRELGEAVRRRHLPDDATKADAHRKLARYFAERPIGPRQLDEMPWQLACAGEWNLLVDALTERRIFVALWDRDEHEVRRLWATIENQSAHRMITALNAFITCPADDPAMEERVALLLASTGHSVEARDMLAALEARAIELDDEDAFRSVQGNLAVVQTALGEHEDAIRRFQSLEKLARDHADIPLLITTITNMVEIHINQGRMAEAESLCQEQESLCRDHGDTGGLYRCLGKQGQLLCLSGQRDKAVLLFRDAELLARQLGDRAGTAAALMDQAFVARTSGRFDTAMELYREAENLARTVHAPQQLHETLGGQAVIHEILGELEKAMELYVEAEKISRITQNSAGLFKALHHQSLLLAWADNLSGALELQAEAEAICRAAGDAHGLYRCLGCQGLMWEQAGDLDKALDLARQAETICDALGDLDGKQASLSAQASVLASMGEIQGAAGILLRVEAMCRQLGDPLKLAMALVKRAALMARELNDPKGAQVIAREALHLARQFSLKDLEQEAIEIIEE